MLCSRRCRQAERVRVYRQGTGWVASMTGTFLMQAGVVGKTSSACQLANVFPCQRQLRRVKKERTVEVAVGVGCFYSDIRRGKDAVSRLAYPGSRRCSVPTSSDISTTAEPCGYPLC